MSRNNESMELARELCGEGEYYQDCFHCPTLRCCGTQAFARRLYDKGYRKSSEVAEEIFGEALDNSTLGDWYISSVDGRPPVWTEAHIEELLNDFYVIPKEIADGYKM